MLTFVPGEKLNYQDGNRESIWTLQVERSGDKVGAAADVNLLKARANASYIVSAADMDDKFNTILDERARELVYEEAR